MSDRTSLLLQCVIAFCVWALLALYFGGWLLGLRDQAISQGLQVIPGSALLGAALFIALEVTLLGFAIHRLLQALRIRLRRGI
jgi:hypothetical protein